AEDGIRDRNVTGVQTCALPISDTADAAEAPAGSAASAPVAAPLRSAGLSPDHVLCTRQQASGAPTTRLTEHTVAGVLMTAAAFRSEERRVGNGCGSGSAAAVAT